MVSGLARQRLYRFLCQASDGFFTGCPMDPDIGDAIQPVPALPVRIGQVAVLQAGPEVASDGFDAVLDLALGLRPVRPAGSRREAILSGKMSQVDLGLLARLGLEAQRGFS